MARVATGTDDRGVVYVEFLIAFFPLFLLFLALCQLALIGSAEAIVRHAAYAAIRSAIVTLEDDPERFDGADRGSLSQGRLTAVKDIYAVASKLGIAITIDRATWVLLTNNALYDQSVYQYGARMVPIRTAALLPLLPIAPSQSTLSSGTESIGRSLVAPTDQQLGFAVTYTKTATEVTLHDSAESEALALDPIGSKAMVTARVSYLFHCTIPVVRAVMCSTLNSIATQGQIPMALANKTEQLASSDARFKLLRASASLPNQGAGYLQPGAK
jgi:Flp pilus assembly protein TadG